MAQPARSAAYCTLWDHSDIPVQPTGCRSESAYSFALPIPKGLRHRGSATKKIDGSFPRSQTLEPAIRLGNNRWPTNHAALAASGGRRAATEYIQYAKRRLIED